MHEPMCVSSTVFVVNGAVICGLYHAAFAYLNCCSRAVKFFLALFILLVACWFSCLATFFLADQHTCIFDGEPSTWQITAHMRHFHIPNGQTSGVTNRFQ